MARRGRPTVEITLSGDERKTLQRWARRHSSSERLALRCRIVIACAEGDTNTRVAVELGVNPVTVHACSDLSDVTGSQHLGLPAGSS